MSAGLNYELKNKINSKKIKFPKTNCLLFLRSVTYSDAVARNWHKVLENIFPHLFEDTCFFFIVCKQYVIISIINLL